MFKRKNNQKLDEILQELQLNLENNYKDLAISLLKEATSTLEELRDNSSLDDKLYIKYKAKIEVYSIKMKDYHH